MQNGKEIKIAGAGPSGMTAGIILAKAGYSVTIYEQRNNVGSRFNDDYQGLENWSRKQDVLDELAEFGIKADWWIRPFNGGTLFDSKLRGVEVDSADPLFYLVRRGSSHPRSLDLSLLQQAKSLGVKFEFNKRVQPHDVAIMAGGPKGNPQAIAAGITFDIDRDDFACGILNEGLAPSGYVYFLIADQQATLATVLFKDFDKVHECLDQSIQTIAKMFSIPEILREKQWGGYGNFFLSDTSVKDNALYVGEAAGFQDFLFGFGIRNAMVSGGLAARSIIEGQNYDLLWKERLGSQLQASFVNRYLFHKYGELAKQGFWYISGLVEKPDTFLNRLYNYTFLHRIVYKIIPKKKVR